MCLSFSVVSLFYLQGGMSVAYERIPRGRDKAVIAVRDRGHGRGAWFAPDRNAINMDLVRAVSITGLLDGAYVGIGV